MKIRDQIITSVVEAGGQLKVKSALNPVLWLCAIITAPGSYFMSKDWPLFAQIITFCPVVTAMIGFFYLLFFDRDKLQSEDFQLRKRTLEIAQEKGDDFPQIANTLTMISNPTAKLLESRRQEDTE
ncbi:hypothetical protein [Undibacterium sp. Tian12W]|uniref:hypothetical protein n=1 Tax=Undibacterium sp. Tian12W TaxID=3413054 RepID=UPI003BF3FB6F